MATAYDTNQSLTSSSKSLPFLPCHLEMLKTLYQSDDGRYHDSKDIATSSGYKHELSVNDETWIHISKFLLTKRNIEQILERASFHSGIYKEACSIGPKLNPYLRTKMNTLETPTRIKRNPMKATNTNDVDMIGFSDRAPLPPKSSFGQVREKKRKMPSSPSFLSPLTKIQKQRQRLQYISTTSSLTSSSWTLVTKLLDRRKKTTQSQFKEISHPYFKLFQFVRDKIQELHKIISIMTTLQTDKRHLITSRLNSDHIKEDDNDINDICDSNISMYCNPKINHDSHIQDNIVKMTIKVNLWQRLADNLALVMMHQEI